MKKEIVLEKIKGAVDEVAKQGKKAWKFATEHPREAAIGVISFASIITTLDTMVTANKYSRAKIRSMNAYADYYGNDKKER